MSQLTTAQLAEVCGCGCGCEPRCNHARLRFCSRHLRRQGAQGQGTTAQLRVAAQLAGAQPLAASGQLGRHCGTLQRPLTPMQQQPPLTIHAVASPPRFLRPLPPLDGVCLAAIPLDQHLAQQRLRLLQRGRPAGGVHAQGGRGVSRGILQGAGAAGARLRAATRGDTWSGGMHGGGGGAPRAMHACAPRQERHRPAVASNCTPAHHVAPQRLLLGLKVPAAQRVRHHRAQLGRLLQAAVGQHHDRRLRLLLLRGAAGPVPIVACRRKGVVANRDETRGARHRDAAAMLEPVAAPAAWRRRSPGRRRTDPRLPRGTRLAQTSGSLPRAWWRCDQAWRVCRTGRGRRGHGASAGGLRRWMLRAGTPLSFSRGRRRAAREAVARAGAVQAGVLLAMGSCCGIRCRGA